MESLVITDPYLSGKASECVTLLWPWEDWDRLQNQSNPQCGNKSEGKSMEGWFCSDSSFPRLSKYSQTLFLSTLLLTWSKCEDKNTFWKFLIISIHSLKALVWLTLINVPRQCAKYREVRGLDTPLTHETTLKPQSKNVRGSFFKM